MKYEPLEKYLTCSVQDVAVLEFAEIERIIGTPLPFAARKYPTWWSNSSEGQANAKVWLRAGVKAEQIDLESARVTFRRAANPSSGDSKPGPGLLERVRAALGGTVTIMPGVDLTEPLWEWVDEDDFV
jgi:hypothetical protein